MVNMKTACRWRWWCMAGAGLTLAALTGCQTWIAGMTLPSGHYLQHPPQFFAPEPPFTLTNELARQEETYGAGVAVPGAPAPPPAGALPAPVPGVPPPP